MSGMVMAVIMTRVVVLVMAMVGHFVVLMGAWEMVLERKLWCFGGVSEGQFGFEQTTRLKLRTFDQGQNLQISLYYM